MREARKIMTLCIVYQHPRILLGMKKRGFGVGKWNGFGGKVDDGETVEDAAVREMREEAGIEVSGISKIGVIDFRSQVRFDKLEVHIFRAEQFVGNPRETDEMKPRWFHVDEIPYKKMWSDDPHWMPLFLAGKNFRGSFLFDKNDKIVDMRVLEVRVV